MHGQLKQTLVSTISALLYSITHIDDKNDEFLECILELDEGTDNFDPISIKNNFFVTRSSFLPSIQTRFLCNLCTILIKLTSIRSYFPEVRAFGTLIMSTEVLGLHSAKSFDHAP